VQLTKRRAWTLVLCCVFLAALFGLVCAFDEDGDLGGALCQADGRSRSPDEVSRTLPFSAARRHLVGPAAALGISAPGLLAAVPGGLCLLI